MLPSHKVPALLALFSIGAFCQEDLMNYGGPRRLKISPGEKPIRGLYIDQSKLGSTDDPLGDAGTNIPIDAYQLVNLTPHRSYKLIIEKVDGYSGFNVIDRFSGQSAYPNNVTHFEETITASTTWYAGPVEISCTGGVTSFLPGGLGYASTVYQISLIDAATPTTIIAPATGIHDGMVIKSVDAADRTVYLVENGTKRAFPSSFHFNSWYFQRWDLITSVASFAVNNIPTGAEVPFKEGTLLKYSDRPADQTVFLIQGGLRRAFTTWASFTSFGHSASDILTLPGSILDSVNRGTDMGGAGTNPNPQGSVLLRNLLTFRGPYTGNNCSVPAQTTSFTGADDVVYLFYFLENLRSGNYIERRWIHLLSGAVYFGSNTYDGSDAFGCSYTHGISTTDYPTGQWRVELWVDGKKLGETSFTIAK